MLCAAAAAALVTHEPVRAQVGGGDAWQQYADAAEAGFSATLLASARTYADSVGSAAVVAVYRGHVIAAWGDVARRIPAHSVRKGFVSALYGTAVARGELSLDATLADHGIDDIAGLTETERSARLRDLVAARSGVYLPAAYAPNDQDETRPKRGSHAPGTHWFYNNWDFNVAGVIIERATGSDLYELFDARIAQPAGMEDYRPADGLRVLEPSRSRHPAHTFSVSARDMARFGQLYLQRGRWGDRQVLPAEWIRESTRAHSQFDDGSGYGWMWWTYEAGAAALGDGYPNLSAVDLYMARGTGGQAIFVIPAAELVIVHRGDTDNNRPVIGAHAWGLAERILAARTGDPVAQPRLTSLTPTPLASQLPPATLPRFITLERAALERLVGSYELAPGVNVRVFLHDGRAFINVPGEGEAEMYALTADEFTIRVQAGVGIRFESDADGSVTGVVLTLGPQTMRARRRR